jgi:hypothetical protein
VPVQDVIEEIWHTLTILKCVCEFGDDTRFMRSSDHRVLVHQML